MKKALLLFAALLVAGCGEKSSSEGSESASEKPTGEPSADTAKPPPAETPVAESPSESPTPPSEDVKPSADSPKPLISDADVERLLKEAVDGEAGFEVREDGRMIHPNGSGLLSGWVKFQDEYGKGLQRFKDGKMDGPEVNWYANGQKESEINWKDGKLDGLWIWWHENGQKQEEATHKDGERISARYWNSKGEEVETWEESVPEARIASVAAGLDDLTWTTTDGEVTITGCDVAATGDLSIQDNIEGNPVTSIGDRAFNGCRSLTTVIIPDGVTSIGNTAFTFCTSLYFIYIPESVTSIGIAAFSHCSSLLGAFIPHGVTSIEFGAFSACSSLPSVTIPDSVTSIGGSAFGYCTGLTSITFFGDAPKARESVFSRATPTIYRKPEAKGWGETWGGRPVKLISEKP